MFPEWKRPLHLVSSSHFWAEMKGIVRLRGRDSETRTFFGVNAESGAKWAASACVCYQRQKKFGETSSFSSFWDAAFVFMGRQWLREEDLACGMGDLATFGEGESSLVATSLLSLLHIPLPQILHEKVSIWQLHKDDCANTNTTISLKWKTNTTTRLAKITVAPDLAQVRKNMLQYCHL